MPTMRPRRHAPPNRTREPRLNRGDWRRRPIGSPECHEGSTFISVPIERGQADIQNSCARQYQPPKAPRRISHANEPDITLLRTTQSGWLRTNGIRATILIMRAVVTSNNPIRLSFLVALLADAGIETTLLDAHTSVLEGSAGAIPRRLMVASEDYAQACRLLRDAGEW